MEFKKLKKKYFMVNMGLPTQVKAFYRLKPMLMYLLLAYFAFITLAPGQEQPQPSSNSQSNSAEMSPSQRRAFIRDSLRAERLKRREAVSNSSQPANTSKPTPVSNSQSNVSPSNTSASSASSEESKTEPSTAPKALKQNQAKKHSVTAEELPIPDSIIVEALSVRDTEIRDILTGLASQYNVNILIDRDVQGKISISLNKIPLKQALPLIVTENGFQLSVVHGTVKVSNPPAPEPEPEPEPPFEINEHRGLLTVDIKDIPVDKVVRKLVDVTGKIITLESDATGTISAYYKELETDKAISLILETNGFRLHKKDSILSISRDAWVAASDGKSTGGKSRIYIKGNLVSMEVTEAPLAQVINSITTQAHLSAVVYGSISGSVTAKLDNIPIADALTYLFRGTDYTFWLHNNIYFIGSKEMKAMTNSKLLVLKHMKADEIMDLIPADLIKDMKVKVVPGQNALMAMGTYEGISNLEDYINKIDLPVAQILIEALVVDLDMDKIRNYGVNLFLGSTRGHGPEVIYPDFRMTMGKEESEELLSGIPGLRDIISLPKSFVARVEALEKEKVLRIKSRPQIATLNGKTASITVGQTQYFLLKSEVDYNQVATTTTKTQERFEKIQADITLTVTPFVTGEGEITVEIVPDFSEPEGSFSSNVPPTINRRNLKSTVRLRQGETIVLGGLVKEGLIADRAQFPILGSIPIVGWLFKNNNTTKSRTQLMIFVTPHIYYGSDANVDTETYLDRYK